MNKTITVYVVSTSHSDKTVTFGTRSQAEKAIDLLAKLDIEATVEQSKKVINID